MKSCLLFASMMLAITATAEVNLPAIISDHMVLRKAADTPVWGTAAPDETVKVTLADATATATADADGNWQVELDLSDSAPGPFEMSVTGKNQLVVHDVLVGEVWVASGQSNMGFLLERERSSAEEIPQSNYPMIRQFQVAPYVSIPEPREECEGKWVVCSPETAGRFTAVGYFFAKSLVQELDVPVGLLFNAWGGTPVEAWMSQDAIAQNADLKARGDKAIKDQIEYKPRKKAYDKAFAQWLKDTGREDHFPKDVEAYAGMDVDTTDWQRIDMPSTIFGGDLPEDGVVWLRGEVNIPANMLNGKIPVRIGSMEAFPTVYWNGEKVSTGTFENYPGKGYTYRYYISAPHLKEGKNVVAIRFYAPYGNTEKVDVHCDFAPFIDGLKAKVEYTLPPLTPAQKTSMPQALDNPLRGQDVATYLYNGMIAPILRYGISGVIWYQGESNVSRGYDYRIAFPLMIQDWREKWGQGDFPFYFCQLANIGDKQRTPEKSAWAATRESQAAALDLPNTGMAVLIDLGEAKDVHARNKSDVGDRLARIALAETYGQDVEPFGPMFESMDIEGDKLVLSFSHVGDGLEAKSVPDTYVLSSLSGKTAPLVRNSPESELEGFAVCGKDRKWAWAEAKIEGDQVVVWSDSVKEPIAVRYSWGNNPSGNLYNSSGLPAAPFRTDEFPVSSQGNHYYKAD
ncbi:sialate O-acetylesterase [Ruficoccus sp. ZRK36]|uniref:sialate O-acetylesterase n=1 Tax=Ruficoccus sp. ZRK36 TaxID=2866311 RepID=UPI001C7305D1|nr:sialate O-acetylesterase [Ruficoccus sp. ZRK36]QYY34388.1 sialate O-acetylesterase [Ruficoccus sp. ZRK36]